MWGNKSIELRYVRGRAQVSFNRRKAVDSQNKFSGRIANNKKKTVSLKTKLDILRRFFKGAKAVEIAKAVGPAVTTVRTIKDRDGNKIKEAAKSAAL